VAPTKDVYAVLSDGTTRVVDAFHWGLIPLWAKDAKIGSRMINARAETLAEKNAYKSAFKRRRCLIPADGFYEWHGEGDARQPWYIAREDGRPFGFAGLWQPPFGPDGQATCTIVTTDPLPPVAAIHDRMPRLLARDEHALWLDPGAPREEIARLLLTPPRVEALVAHPVGKAVNSAANDDPSLREPAAAAPRQRGLFDR
jgi:putative SOS response-associated peptidase YedK